MVKDPKGVKDRFTKDDFACSGLLRKGHAIYSCKVDTVNMVQQYKTYSMVIAGIECRN